MELVNVTLDHMLANATKERTEPHNGTAATHSRPPQGQRRPSLPTVASTTVGRATLSCITDIYK